MLLTSPAGRRPRLELADIVRRHRRDYVNRYGRPPGLRHYVLDCITNCRTAGLGGHRLDCPQCGYSEQAYNSCRNRHCNKCQGATGAAWLEKRLQELLPVEYFHVVFTLPESIAHLALQNPVLIYKLLFDAASRTLQEVAANPKRLGAKIGFYAVLHTWGQTLHFHPHLHIIVPGGGLSPDGRRWISCPRGFFLPVRVLSQVFRGKILEGLRNAYDQGELAFHGSLKPLERQEAFDALLDVAYGQSWVVYAEPPAGGPEQVLKYLARYVHRVAISNDRLVSLEEDQVRFRWKDYAKGRRLRTMEVSAVEFIRRFLTHVLPKRFVRIRQYGFLANCHRKENLALCRRLLAESSATEGDDPTTACDSDNPPLTLDQFQTRCPRCRGLLIHTKLAARPLPLFPDTS